MCMSAGLYRVLEFHDREYERVAEVATGAIYRKRQCLQCGHRFKTREPHAFCPGCKVKTRPYGTIVRKWGRVVIRYRRCPVCLTQNNTKELPIMALHWSTDFIQLKTR